MCALAVMPSGNAVIRERPIAIRLAFQGSFEGWIKKVKPSSTFSSSQSGGPVQPIISISDLTKTYASGFQALKEINLHIWPEEIFALLGPNGAGKTTLIGIICGIVNPTRGIVMADGHDVISDYRAARSKIGLVPQELSTDSFETVWATVSFSRGLFGKPTNPDYIEKVLKNLFLWDRKDSKILTLSGGMKPRGSMSSFGGICGK
jgi:ABC-2 type transport system ATP-binding protein